MAGALTKPLLVPEYGNGLIKLYIPSASGQPQEKTAYTVNVTAALDTLFPGAGRIGAPNAAALLGADLFFTNSSSNSQAALKLPNYLKSPATAIAQAFVFTLDGDDYVGLAFDAAGNLYVAEGSYGNNQIVRYTGTNAPYPGAAKASVNTYGSKIALGNAGKTSYFGDLAFDAAGNLWAADYLNSRVVVFEAATLASGAPNWHALVNTAGPFNVANNDASLNSPAARILAEPEGLAFDSSGSLWVGNNNDGSSLPQGLTSLVQLTPALQTALLATGNGGALSAAQIQPNVNLFIYQTPASAAGAPQFGGVQIDRGANRLYVNEEVEGDIRGYDLATLAAITSDPASTRLAIVATNPGNGGIALLPVSPYIADSAADTGAEPDVSSPVFWESPAISIIQPSGGTLATLPPPEQIAGGAPGFVYVQVSNAYNFPTLGIETLNVYWAKGGSTLVWPQSWNGSLSDPNYPASPLGGLIEGNIALPSIPAKGSIVVGPIEWPNPPDPTKYTTQDGHFCLLTRITTPGEYGDGMTFPETSASDQNVLKNGRIAQRNIHILDVGSPPAADLSKILVGNFRPSVLNLRLTFQIIDAQGRLQRSPGGPITLARLGRDEPRPTPVPDPTAGFAGLPLAPGEQAAFAIGFAPPEGGANYALRVSAFNDTPAGPLLLGGQTFVRGKVAGFPVKAKSTAKPGRGLLWLLLLLLLALIFILRH